MQITYCDACEKQIEDSKRIGIGKKDLVWERFSMFSVNVVIRERDGESVTLKSADLCYECTRKMFIEGTLQDCPK